MVLEVVAGEALEVVFPEKFAEEGGVAALHGDVPGQHHRKIEQDAGNPDGAAEDRPLAAQADKEQDDAKREEGSDGALGECRGGAEEVEIEEPEFLAGLIPGVPAKHADAEW